jgi:cytochrome b
MALSPQPFLDADAPSRAPDAAAPPRTRIRLWDLPTRVFHWSLVVAVLTAVITGQVGGDWMKVHGIAGLAIVGLVVFRLLWGFLGSTHARFASFVPRPSTVWRYLRGRWQGVGHNPLGALSVLALLGLLAAQAATGLFGNDDISFAGPLASRVSESLSTRLTGLHHQLADALLILIGLHVVAIVVHLLFKKDNLVTPMVTGYKQVHGEAEGELPPGASRRGGWVAFAIALASALAAVYLASGAGLPAGPQAVQVPAAPSHPSRPATPGW